MSGVQAVIFDYGGVLTTPVRDSLSAWLARDAIDPASFTRVLRRWLSRSAPIGTPIHKLETGEITIAQFDDLLARELLTTDGGPVRAERLSESMFAGLRPDPRMAELITDLSDAGARVGLLSNSWGNVYPPDLLERCDSVVISSQVGVRKPDAAIFGLALRDLGVTAARALFVDDSEVNVMGAEDVGMLGLVHHDPRITREYITHLVPALPRKSSLKHFAALRAHQPGDMTENLDNFRQPNADCVDGSTGAVSDA